MPNRTTFVSMQMNEKKKSPPSDAWNCNCCKLSAKHRRRSEQIKMRVRSTHKRVLRPVAIVAGWWDEGVFFSQTHNFGGCTTRVFVLRCGTTIKRVDSLYTETPVPLASLGFGLCCCRSTLARSSSTDRANASQFVKSKGRGIFACQYESRGVQYLQQDCRTGSCTGSAVERRSAVS